MAHGDLDDSLDENHSISQDGGVPFLRDASLLQNRQSLDGDFYSGRLSLGYL